MESEKKKSRVREEWNFNFVVKIEVTWIFSLNLKSRSKVELKKKKNCSAYDSFKQTGLLNNNKYNRGIRCQTTGASFVSVSLDLISRYIVIHVLR